ncbi:putative zinc finger BED domain-containing protein RICESLEEPER 1-like [Heracleum sosnowskyi]|uniref:Zinc finger BED domain-containing protein RICESLEEPER 1-like n=1 Tax=Heracleum sosnowskyi TaxID=360622 RepID=A0AAD8IHB2_9APIA|nr:putative zinc finger BED domain-containing protein RICESLEEPER 1-like [Heracleum sosnowskyi]
MDKGKRKIIPSHRIARFFPKSTASDNESGCDVEKVYEAMARFICQEEHVTLPAIKMLVTEMNPSFPFSYLDLGRSIFKVYLEERAKVIQIMENLDARIALSVDIVKLDTYGLRKPKGSDEQDLFDILCLRAHFIDDNWKPKSWVLYYGDVDRIMETGYDRTILKRISDLRIESKISTVTRGYREMHYEVVEVVEDLVKEKKTLQIKCQPFKLVCCANLLSKMVEAAFKDIEDIIWKILQKNFMYWHITFSRLQDAIKAEAAGEFSEQFGSIFFDPPTEEEWTKLKYVCRLVDYIYNAAEVLFFTKNPTASIYLHNLRELQASLRKESTSPDSLSISRDLLKQFDEYWKDMFLVLAIATVLDPRCKLKYIEFTSMKYDDNSGNSKVTAVLEAIQGIYDDYRMHSLEALNSSKPSESKPSESKPSDMKLSDSEPSDPDSEEELPWEEKELPRHTLERLQKCNFGFNCIDEYNEFIKPSNRPPKSELEWYFDEPVLPWTNDFDLMSWWRAESPKYPILSKMARDFLAIPFSVVSSYEAYYYRDFRPADTNLAFLGPGLPNALVCCRSYFRKE